MLKNSKNYLKVNRILTKDKLKFKNKSGEQYICQKLNSNFDVNLSLNNEQLENM
jgi:hypothetical protein